MRALLLLALLTTCLQAEGFTRADLQKFIDDAIAAGGGQVILPPGTHTLDAPLVIKNAGKLRLVGLDVEDTFLQPVKDAPKGFPLLQIEGTATALEITKITFTTTGDAFANFPLIDITGTTKKDASTTVQIDRCFFQYHPGPGIQIANAKDSRITANTFMDLGGPAIHATGTTTALTLQHNHLTRTATPSIQFDATSTNAQLIANELQSGTIQLQGQGHQLHANSLPSSSKKP
jgi:hypothetical protein